MNKRKLSCFGLAFIILAVLFVILDRPSLTQEGNPILLMPELISLERGKTDIAVIPSNPKLLITKMDDGKHRVIDRYLARKGWDRNDQQGALLPYYRGKERLDVIIRIYLHGRYWAYELDRKP